MKKKKNEKMKKRKRKRFHTSERMYENSLSSL